MRYAYSDLGEQPEGATAVVRWGGSPATVMLLDPVNFEKYVDRLPCRCNTGGRYRCSPARLSIPEHGRWYAVVDLGGNTSGIRPTVQVMREDAGAGAKRDEPERARA
ncbi:MAG TPA: DUF1883 domain-containing protein [Solirubrobacteraceae bacterium]|nr:DUF1883 domain-containing protein [Solirubrobacteraceae bacterium]